MATAIIDDTSLARIADSIRRKRGTSRTCLPSEMAAAIGGITGLEEKEVNFYDYDGLLLYSYTKAEALALTELPSLPNREDRNLYCEGWNMTLADIGERIGKGMHYVAVGCVYRTLDNKTHLYVKPDSVSPTLYLRLSASAANDTVIDWGDGSAVTSVPTAYTTYSHTYDSQLFDSEIDVTIVSTSGVHRFNTYVGGGDENNKNNKITRAFMSGSARFAGNYIFSNTMSLEQVTLHKDIIKDETNAAGFNFWFDRCQSLKHLNIPNITVGYGILRYSSSTRRASIPSMLSGYYSFSFCYSLDKCETLLGRGTGALDDIRISQMYYTTNVEYVYLDDRITSTEGNPFMNCFSLKEIVLPSTLTLLARSTFTNSYSLDSIYLRAVTPPALDAAFSLPNGFCTIYVPRASYNDYITAENWSNIASRIQPYDFN